MNQKNRDSKKRIITISRWKLIVAIIIPIGLGISPMVYDYFLKENLTDFEKVESKLEALDKRISREENWLKNVNQSNKNYSKWSNYIIKASQYRDDAWENWSDEEFVNSEENIRLSYQHLNKLPNEPVGGVPWFLIIMGVIFAIIVGLVACIKLGYIYIEK